MVTASDTITDIRKALRRKPLWRVEDFATYMGWEHQAARRQLLKYNRALSGLLLRTSDGTNRVYTFYWALLAKHAPEAFLDDPIEQQKRVDTIEDAIDEMRLHMRTIAQQTGHNTRDIVKIRASRAARRAA